MYLDVCMYVCTYVHRYRYVCVQRGKYWKMKLKRWRQLCENESIDDFSFVNYPVTLIHF